MVAWAWPTRLATRAARRVPPSARSDTGVSLGAEAKRVGLEEVDGMGQHTNAGSSRGIQDGDEQHAMGPMCGCRRLGAQRVTRERTPAVRA